MEIITSYKDLCGEIELLEFLLTDLQRQLKATHKIINTGKAPSSIPCFVPLDKSLAQYDNIMERAERIQDEIQEKEQFKQQIKERLSRLEGLDYKVYFLHRIEGKSLQVVAHELNYSYDWIKKISSRTSKAPSKHQAIAK